MRATYDNNKATLPKEETQNARNYGNEKETVNERKLVTFDARERRERLDPDYARSYGATYGSGFRTAVDARFYMGRSSNSSVVYCSVWIRARDGRSFAGRGSAGGYGYHKASAAFADAVASAGIKLEASVSGAGDSAIDYALEAIAKAAGYGRLPMAIL